MSITSLARRLAAAPVVFLDCDGVIFDANRFKLEALSRVLQDFDPASHGPMRDYWRASGGVSRYVKFEHFVRDILGLQGEAASTAIARSIEQFAEGSRAGYARHAPLPEALHFARGLGPERLVVISGTDQDELRQVFKQKGLMDTFPCVLGSPTPKPAHIREQLTLRGANPAECLFLGDGAGDFRASAETGVHFLYLAQMSEWTDASRVLHKAPHVSCFGSWPALLSEAERTP